MNIVDIKRQPNILCFTGKRRDIIMVPDERQSLRMRTLNIVEEDNQNIYFTRKRRDILMVLYNGIRWTFSYLAFYGRASESVATLCERNFIHSVVKWNGVFITNEYGAWYAWFQGSGKCNGHKNRKVLDTLKLQNATEYNGIYVHIRSETLKVLKRKEKVLKVL